MKKVKLFSFLIISFISFNNYAAEHKPPILTVAAIINI